MTKKCEHKKPSVKVTLHVPQTSWHPHKDKIIEAKEETEFEAWARAMYNSLEFLTQGHARLMVGYLGDALNVLPEEMRKAMLQVLALGLGLEIKKSESAPDSIDVNLVQRYPPLVQQQPKSGELVVPQKSADSCLILPGQSGYNGG